MTKKNSQIHDRTNKKEKSYHGEEGKKREQMYSCAKRSRTERLEKPKCYMSSHSTDQHAAQN